MQLERSAVVGEHSIVCPLEDGILHSFGCILLLALFSGELRGRKIARERYSRSPNTLASPKENLRALCACFSPLEDGVLDS